MDTKKTIDVFNGIEAIIYKTLEMDPVRDRIEIDANTRLIEDLGFESILLIQLVMNIEDHFDIVFEAEKLLAENLNVVGKLTIQVEEMIDEKCE